MILPFPRPLRALRAFPAVRGLVFGAYGEMSEDVHTLMREIATLVADREWGHMGARSRSWSPLPG